MSTDSSVIDAFAFARHGEQRSGVIPITRLTRVVDGLPDQRTGGVFEAVAGETATAQAAFGQETDQAIESADGQNLVSWSAQGELDSSGRPFLRLNVAARPILECQRCMQPFVHPIDSTVMLLLVNSPAELDDETLEDDDIDPDAPEKVVGSPRFNLLEHVEDELVLCIPYVPKHEICPSADLIVPEQSEPVPEESQKRPSPFSVLAHLKKT